MKNKLYLLLVMVLALLPVTPVFAQDPAPQVIAVTMPIADGVKEHVNAWLATAAPAQYPYWAITYAEQRGLGWLVSIAALSIEDPAQKWYITDHAAWLGTVMVYADGTVAIYADDPATTESTGATFKLAALPAQQGGGAHLRFPWEEGGSMMYGPRGVHDAGGGGAYAEGFLAVDFVGGDDLGSGAASPKVYAADAGTVDYRCADGTSTLVRLHNEESGEYYIYAHLIDNANLVQDHEFSAGSFMGNLRYGTFDDNCGWAEQQDDHYHLHFGFEAEGNSFRMEDCILNTGTEKWNCGNRVVSTGGFLVSNGAGGTGGSGSVNQPSFFDYFVAGVIDIYDTAILSILPDHQAIEFTNVLYETVSMTVKLAQILVYSNVNLGPLVTIVGIAFGIKMVLGLAEFVVFLFKAWKSLVPVLGA